MTLHNDDRPTAECVCPRNSSPLPQIQNMQPSRSCLNRTSVQVMLPPSEAASQHKRSAIRTTDRHLSTSSSQKSSRLKPPEDTSLRPHPETARVLFHNANLRSPLPGDGQLPPGSQPPLYQYVTGYALPPTRIDDYLGAQSFTLNIPQADIVNVPNPVPGLLPWQPGVPKLREGSILYRLRCRKMSTAEGSDIEAFLMTAENIWPSMFCFAMNKTSLLPWCQHLDRRGPSVDLSGGMLDIDRNIFEVHTVPDPSEINNHVVAIERISVSSHASIVSAITSVSATDSLAAIRRLLQRPTNEDGDMTIATSTLTVSLLDPYESNRIWDTPVRGSTCLHRECFDLETFLAQRRREQHVHSCATHCWRCPICRGHVRPQHLVKDGSLVQVREELARKNLLNTQAIVIDVDGFWKPRVEAQQAGVQITSFRRGGSASVRLR